MRPACSANATPVLIHRYRVVLRSAQPSRFEAHDGSGVPLFDGEAGADLEKGDRLSLEVELVER